ncbi:MAG: c-type cytochrome biogenesis protein CcmI [Pseudomonadota bacterium]
MADLAFWVAVAVMLAGVAVVLWQALRRPQQASPSDLRVYSDQLAEVDRDLARGTVDPAEAQRLRTEISRRLLEASRAEAAKPLPSAASDAASGAASHSGTDRQLVGPLLVVGVALVAAVVFYARIGAPGYPDLPLASRLAQSDEMMRTRPSQAAAEAQLAAPAPPAPDAEFAQLMTRLRAAVADRPGDVQGLELLARNETALGNLAAAQTATEQLIAAKGTAATAKDHAELAELRIRAAGGYVSPEAEADLVRALQKDPKNPVARYFSGLMFAQGGRQDRTFLLWRRLLEESPPEAPWVPLIRAQMPDIVYRAGVRYELPPLRGPTAGDVADAAGQSAEDQAAMVEGMVAQLSGRLATEGGTVEEWGQLIRALGVLKRQDEAARIYAEAKTYFDGQASSLSFLKEAAVMAGLAP